MSVAVSAEVLYQALKRSDSGLGPVQFVKVMDISAGCGTSFSIEVHAQSFENVKVIDRNRMIHTALAEYMPSIHALQLKCYSP